MSVSRVHICPGSGFGCSVVDGLKGGVFMSMDSQSPHLRLTNCSMSAFEIMPCVVLRRPSVLSIVARPGCPSTTCILHRIS